ncbi:unnamed protein product [Fusarium equiseti]|uniref:Uncharacterized protein n=1 Tax=Fusarium equiseti TaxID=61235 RepID=A0A8J2IIY7_FUSEQ|nr:unnamed protein product [Fusarium equiseti]
MVNGQTSASYHRLPGTQLEAEDEICSEIIPEERRPGHLKRSVENDMIRWYSALGANIQHSWVPRKAKVRGYSPEPQPSPSLLSLQGVQEPALIFVPQAVPAERRRRRQLVQPAEGPRSSEDPVKNEDPEDLIR